VEEAEAAQATVLTQALAATAAMATFVL
jgi:hypothetical protein